MKFLSQINVNTEYTLPFVDGNNGQVLTTDGQGAVYWGNVSAGSTSLDGLTDVEITSPQAGQILNYSVPLGGTVPVWRNITSPYAPIASPTFTGTPAAPTAPTATNTTQIATTAFVKAQGYLSSSSSINDLGDVTISTVATGQILQWNGTAWVNATLSTVDYVSKVQHLVKCGVAVTKGQAVYVTSADGTNMIVGLASNASEATSSKVIGLAVSTGAINDQIFVVTEGLIAGLNTSTATAGDPVWLGTGGNLIFGLLNKPVAPAHLVYLGVVTRVQQNNGEIFVNVQNGFELHELHDVLISSPSAGQLLRRDSDGLWKNWTPNYLTSLPTHNHDDRYYTESEIIAFFGGETEIAGYNQTNWDTAYGWGNHATAGYLTSFTETDPTVPTHVKTITTTEKSNWNTAYGWGNHAVAGYATQAWVGLNYYNEGEIDDFFSGAEPISGYNKSNWDTAYNDKINSASFNTSTGVLTLTQQDAGTITVDLDGRYLSSDSDNQELTWDSGSKTLGITNGNSVVLDLASEDFVTSQGYITGVNYLAIQTIGGDSGAFNLDTVSGQHGFVRFSTGIWAGTNPYPGNYSHVLSMNQSTANGNRTVQMYMGDVPGALFWRMNQGGTLHPWERIWTAGNDGAASGLDADLLDGQHGSYYQPASTAITTSNIGSQSVSYADYTNRTYRGIIEDTRAAQRTPSGYDDYRVSWEFTDQITGIPDWHTVMTMQGWHDGYAAWQIIGPSSTTAHENWYLRSGNTTTWNTLRRIWHNGDFTSTNVSNWNAAYNDRITAVAVSGTGTKTLTLTQQDGGTLTATWTDFDSDTDQQELTWEQGTSTLSISNGNAVILSGFATEDYVLSQGFVTSAGTVAGVVRTVTGTNSAELVRGNMGDNDQARILVGATASNAGYLEIATADDGTEPIYVRQYTGTFVTEARTATLLDGSGNTTFPGIVTAGRYRGHNSIILNNYTTVNPSSNVFLYSQPNDRDAWIFLDSADTGSNWGIYHRQIDSAVGDIPGNSIGFVGGGSSTLQGYINLSNGDAYFRGNLTIGGTFTENSSIRFKENIQPLEPALAKVEKLNPVTYTKITSQEEEIGLIAEEVAELFPEVVTYNEAGQPQGIQYQRLSVILLKALQELTERVNKLENK